jgi:hypothetical protein
MSSAQGRFASVDPVVITTEQLNNPQPLNLYAYVANNPLRFIDLTGKILQCVGNDDQQKPYLKEYNTGAGGPANSPNPQGGIIIRK